MRSLVLLAIFGLVARTALAADLDADRDGLTDFQETHKYFTDPQKPDSDGDGTPDGAWDERREFAYTIRSVVRVMRPVGNDLSDDYQDVRVLEETPTWVKLEVIHYPLNTVASSIEADASWRATARGMKDVTSSTLTSNFDEGMVETLKAGLAAEGVDVDGVDDKTLVEKASAWLQRHTSESSGAFTGYFTHFPEGKPAVHPGCERGMRSYNRGKHPQADQWARDLFAKDMFERGTRGSCTSTAILLTAGLRALGMPTRIVYCIPVIDPTDPSEVAMLAGLRHPDVRRTLEGALGDTSGWCGHTFNEVYVGGRWRRLNYSVLGDNTYGSTFGLMTRVLTVNDWSQARAARTIGVRQSKGAYDDIFGHTNPYSTVELSDRFGAHGQHRSNPKPEALPRDLGQLTDPTWSDSDQGKQLVEGLDYAGFAIFVRVKDYGGSFRALKAYQAAGDGRIWLEADGKPAVALEVGQGGLTTATGEAWILLTVAKDALASGVRYRLRARDPEHWRIEGELPPR